MINKLLRPLGLRVAGNCLLATLLTGCHIGEPAEPETIKLTEIISSVRIGQIFGEFIEGEAPQTSSNTAAPVINGAGEIVKGGSLILGIGQLEGADQLIISLARSGPDYISVNFGDIEPGYYKIDLTGIPVPLSGKRTLELGEFPGNPKYSHHTASSINNMKSGSEGAHMVVITFADSSEVNNFSLGLAAVSDSKVGNYAVHNASVNHQAALSYDLQVSLNWIDLVDIDLHVETPDGMDIFWDRRNGQNGGMLDLDSNPACELDYVNNENITWAGSEPAHGVYTVRVDLWSACEMGSSLPWVVTSRYKGKSNTYTGSFSPSEESRGGAFSGKVLTKIFYYEVAGIVPVLKQPTDNTCWATVATMMMSWKRNQSISIVEAMKIAGPQWLNKFKADEGLSPGEKDKFLTDMALTGEQPMNYTIDGFYRLVSDNGPVWITTNESVPLWSPHARLVTGIYGDGSSENTFLNIVDPWTGSRFMESYKNFIKKFEDMAFGGFNGIQVVHY